MHKIYNSTITMKKFTYFLVLTIIFITLTSCTSSYKSTIKLYIKYMQKEDFEKIYDTLLTDNAKSKFQSFLSQMVNNKDQYRITIENFRSIKKIKIIQVEFYDNNEVAVKFHFINKKGISIDEAWWRLKKIGKKYYIMKFSKH